MRLHGQHSLLIDSLREPNADEIPVPRIAARPGAWIFQWLELQSAFWQANGTAISKKAPPVCRHEVRHLLPLPHVTVKPEATIHRVDHPVATLRELQVLDGAWSFHPGK